MLVIIRNTQALLMLFLFVILHTMWSGKSLRLLMHLTICYIAFVCHQNDVIENYIVSVYVGIVVLANADSVSSVNCVPRLFCRL